MFTWITWLIVTCILLISEAIHPGLFVFLPLSIGCGFASIIAWFGYPLWMQIAIMCIISSILFLVLQTWSQVKTTPATNIDRLVGESGYTITHISPSRKGYVTIDTTHWLAHAEEEIPPQTQIYVTGIRGCHLIVKRNDT